MEAENFLATGYGTRVAIEAKTTGWCKFSELARVWQPSRLKGTVVSSEYGKPYLSATQVFDARPISRRFLSLGQINDPTALEVREGQILITRSGTVGRSTLAHSVHENRIISDDLLRIEAKDRDWQGWIYAYLRAPTVREMMKAAQYGHIIKHLETHHLDHLPIVVPNSVTLRKDCDHAVRRILECRNEAFRKINEAEKTFENQFPAANCGFDETAFTRRASQSLFSARRRMDAWSHNPEKEAIAKRLKRGCSDWTTLQEAGCDVWLPNRFKRVPAEDGVGLIDSSQIFEINPDYTRRISAVGIADKNNGFVKPGWLLMSRSGQVYGLLGSVAMATAQYDGKVVSDDVIRIVAGDEVAPGYLYVAISHPALGRPRAKALAYGSSIPHIEVEDLKEFSIPRLSLEVEQRIAVLAVDAFALWAEANEIENMIGNEADTIVSDFLARKSR